MATSSIVYKSVTLQTGEQFVLPPGATLIGAESIDDLDSTCELPVLEGLTCYIARLGANDDETEDIFLREDGLTTIEGIYLNNVYYPFTSTYSPDSSLSYFNAPALLAELQTVIPGVVQYNHSYYNTNPADSSITFIQIKTVPSIGDNLQLYLKATANAGDFYIRIPFIKRVDAAANVNYPVTLC